MLASLPAPTTFKCRKMRSVESTMETASDDNEQKLEAPMKKSVSSRSNRVSPKSPPSTESSREDSKCCRFLRKWEHPIPFLWALLLFFVLSAIGIYVAVLFYKDENQDLEREALQLAVETGAYFSVQLNLAILPLFSLSTFATELELFRELPEKVGPAGQEDSLPSVPAEVITHRNVTGVCDQPDLVRRFDRIAKNLKEISEMQGILVNLQLAPQAVVCLLYPLNNTEDFNTEETGVFLDNTGALGLDLLTDPFMKSIAEQALSAPPKLSVAGPIQLRQCPTCDPFFIVRMPIAFEEYDIPINGQNYPRWGFATALINWSELVRRSDFVQNFEDNGFTFQLTRTDTLFDEATQEYVQKVVVLANSSTWSDSDLEKDHYVITSLETTDNQWEITVSYHELTPMWIYWIVVAVILISFIVAFLGYIIMVQRALQKKFHLESLEQSARVETETKMTSYFAHELRNPLGAIDCALESMPDDLPSQTNELISGMKLCSRFMSSIMGNLLDARKLEEGKFILTSSPLQLSQVVYGIQKMLLPSVKTGVDFRVECATNGKDWVLGDMLRLEQIFVNVTTNAIKNTKEGSIVLSIKWSDHGTIIFECIDSGPGIPLQEQEKLFERFVQRGSAPGHGLGLTISRKIVTLMGGTIQFESNPDIKPGTNCIVEFSLPVCDPPKDAQSQRDESTKPKFLEGERTLLIVDDVKINRSMLGRRIQKNVAPKWKILEASTGEEALALCEDTKFDVIIVDQYMESANGVLLGTQVVAEMRRRGSQSVLVGNSGNDMMTDFKDCGADLFWTKPLPSNPEMIRQLHDALERRQP